MATSTQNAEYFELTIGYWARVIVAGLVAGVLMGLVMHHVMGTIQAVGALYGREATSFGWAFHLWHAVVFALVFGGVFVWKPLSGFRDQVLSSTTLGIAWATLLWLGAAGVVMPLWLGTVTPIDHPVPNLDPWSGLGHVLYGAVLGGLSAALQKLG